MALKRIRLREEEEATITDRLTSLPEDLQIKILSSLETKHAIQTSMLSKSWSSKWTRVPVLNFSSNGFNQLNVFDNFVSNALSVRGSAKLNKLTFKRSGTCSPKIIKKVIDYAFSQGVEQLEASIMDIRKARSWPIMSHSSSDSLTSLKLASHRIMGCSFLGSRSGSGSFKNLANLHLTRVIITDLDPFSGFPSLKKLTLEHCHIQTNGNALNINAPHLSELTIYYYNQYINRCNLATPNLRYLECRGNNFPRLETCGLPVIDTVVIDYYGFCVLQQERIPFDDLMMWFDVLRKVKSLTVNSEVVHLLSLFLDELANRCSCFGDLKCLKVDFRFFHLQELLFEGECKSFSETLRLVPGVKGYLLQKSHDAKCTIIYPDADA